MALREIFLRPARATPSPITITASPGAALTVTVTPSPTKGYVGTVFNVTAAWTPVSGVPPGYSVVYDWGDGTTNSFNPGSGTPQYTANHQYNSAGTKTIKVTVTDLGTGGSGSGTNTVTVATALTATFTADKTSGTVPLTVTFTVNIQGGYPNYTYSIDPGDGSTPYKGTRTAVGSFTQAHTYTKTGTYTAKCTVDDALGATSSSLISIGAGVTILFPRLRALFPRAFERIDKMRSRLPAREPERPIV